MTKMKSHTIRVYNSGKQQLALQMRAPNSDFFSNEQQVRLSPGQDAELPKSHVRMEQINNLKARGLLKVLYDSEVAAERERALNS
jgi:hypothetical protein